MATVTARPSRLGLAVRGGPFGLLARRTLGDGRVRTIGFFYLFAFVSYLQPVAYRHTYPTRLDRIRFAEAFAHNKAVVFFYGKAYDLLTLGGYSAWRVGGTLSILAAVFGLLAAVRALRAEEESGHTELVLAGAVKRGTAFAASLTAVCATILLIWVAAGAGLIAGGLPSRGSAYLALATVSVAPVFAGVGALISQFAPTRRRALELGGAVVGLCFLLRVIADTSGNAGWVRWLTPLGWAEELRPFTGAQPLVLLLPLATTALLLGAAAAIGARRDIGSGLFTAHESVRPRLRLLTSATAQAVRGERVGLLVWTVSLGALGLVVGLVSKSVTSLGISKQLQRALAKLGAGSALTPQAYIGFAFSFFLVALGALAVSQIAGAWHEEANGRLETVLSQPISRRRWLGGRLVLALGALLVAAVSTTLLTWLGAVSQGVTLSLPRMLEAGLNFLPVAVLFLGVAALAYALAPRAGGPVAYGLLAVTYLWQLFGKLIGAPSWLADATPFAHVGLVPAQPIRLGDAAILAGIGLVGCAAAIARFAYRDLAGG